MKNKYFILIIVVIIAAAAGIMIYKRTRMTVGEKRKYLQSVDGEFRPGPFDQFTDQEVIDAYDFVYGSKTGKYKSPADLPEGLAARITVISSKYKIFT